MPAFGRLNHVVKRRIGFAIGNIFQNAAPKEKWLLQHNANLAAEFIEVDGPNINTVNFDSTFIDIIKPAQQVHQRGLAGAAAADESDHFARSNLKIDVRQHGGMAIVAERNIFKFKTPLHRLDVLRIGWVDDLDGAVEYLKDTVCLRDKLRQPVGELRQGSERAVKHRQITEKSH